MTLLHLHTDYKITEKSIADMTLLQYQTILEITGQISRFKNDNKPLVVI